MPSLREADCAMLSRLRAFFAPTEAKPRPAREIALDARRAAHLQEDEARAAKRLYPTKGQR